jgi:hypothetical protein
MTGFYRTKETASAESCSLSNDDWPTNPLNQLQGNIDIIRVQPVYY